VEEEQVEAVETEEVLPPLEPLRVPLAGSAALAATYALREFLNQAAPAEQRFFGAMKVVLAEACGTDVDPKRIIMPPELDQEGKVVAVRLNG